MARPKKQNREIEIWSPTTEPRESLDARIAACQAQYDMVIVYRSGRGDLAKLTADLLRHNRDCDVER